MFYKFDQLNKIVKRLVFGKMVLITHCGENQEKVKAILDAAQQRFGMYGFDKVTVSEIAADLHMSKAAIYYYFQDKNHLFGAVVEKEHNEYFEQVEKEIVLIESAADRLRKYVEINFLHVKRMMNLTRIKLSEFSTFPQTYEMMCRYNTKAVSIIEEILVAGNRSGEFKVDDVREVASLFIDLLKGLRKLAVGNRDIFYLDDNEMEKLKAQIALFVDLFAKGLKS